MRTTGERTAEPVLQITDLSGAFGFDDVGPGTYAVTFSLDGFQQRQLTTVVVPASSPLDVRADADRAETVRPAFGYLG